MGSQDMPEGVRARGTSWRLRMVLCGSCTQGSRGRGDPWTTVVMSAEGGMPPAAGDRGAGHGRTKAPHVLPTLTEQQNALMKRGVKSNHPHPPHGKNTLR